MVVRLIMQELILFHRAQYSCAGDEHDSEMPEIVQVILLSPAPTPFRPRNKNTHKNASKAVKVEKLTALEQEALAALQDLESSDA